MQHNGCKPTVPCKDTARKRSHCSNKFRHCNKDIRHSDLKLLTQTNVVLSFYIILFFEMVLMRLVVVEVLCVLLHQCKQRPFAGAPQQYSPALDIAYHSKM